MIVSTKVLDSTYAALVERERGINTIMHEGGTYSTKTFSSLCATALYLKQLPIKTKNAVVGQSSTEINNGSYDDWQTIMEEMKIGRCLSMTKRKWLINKSSIEFQSLDTEGKAKSGKWHVTFFNEANHIPYEIYRQRALRSDIKIIDWNPTARFWMHKKVLPTLEPGKFLFKRTTYKDNPTLTQDKINEIEALISDDYMYSVYALGKMPKLYGTVFDFQVYHEDIELKSLNNHGYFLDFGFSNDVTALGEAGMMGNKIFAKQLIYKTGLLTRELNQEMEALGVDKSRPIYCDNIPKEVAELQVYGWILIPTKKYNGSVNDTINLLKQQGGIYIHEKSLDAINEGENYQWLKKDGEFINTPIDKHNHFCDGLRYYGQYNCSGLIGISQNLVELNNLV